MVLVTAAGLKERGEAKKMLEWNGVVLDGFYVEIRKSESNRGRGA